jgi:peptidoglycan/LPS O-acetylase OafA/YrhL
MIGFFAEEWRCSISGSIVPAGNIQVRSPNFPANYKWRTFGHAFDPRNNAFGFLRLTLAVLVIFSHSFHLGGFGRDRLAILTDGRYAIGSLAVAMFFVLSGFLVCRSASACSSVPRFLWHRFLRIFPGYWACLVVCGCILAPLMAFAEFGTLTSVFSKSGNSSQSFIMSNAGLLHLNDFSIGGILFIRPNSIANLLRHNPVPGVFNGSLWSLPYEAACYLAIAALAAAGVLRRARSILLGLFAGLWCLYAFDCLDPEAFSRFFPYPGLKLLVLLGLFFSAGGVLFLYREKIPHSTALFVVSVIALGGTLPLRVFGLIAPVAMSYAFLWLAFALPFGRFEKKGDFSYGTYIYAFPVQQGMALLGVHEKGFGLYFMSSLLLTLILAFLSYRLIEAPCLRLKTVRWSTFRRRAGSPVPQLIESCRQPSATPAIP